jgi:hypothetical protein
MSKNASRSERSPLGRSPKSKVQSPKSQATLTKRVGRVGFGHYMLPVLDIGEVANARCYRCDSEFAVTREPTIAKHCTQKEIGSPPRKYVRFCPFCGAEEVEEA